MVLDFLSASIISNMFETVVFWLKGCIWLYRRGARQRQKKSSEVWHLIVPVADVPFNRFEVGILILK